MLDPPGTAPVAERRRVAALSALGEFDGDAAAFWPAYVEAVAVAFAARRVLVLTVHGDRPWESPVQWPPGAAAGADARRLLRLAGDALDVSPCFDAGRTGGGEGSALAVALALGPQPKAESTVLAVLLPRDARAEAEALLPLASLAADVPLQFLQHLRRRAGAPAPESASAVQDAADAPVPAAEAEEPVPAPAAAPLPGVESAERLYDILQLSTRLQAETRYMRAALALCNELAAAYGCDRVALGRVEGHGVRLGAISHVEKFDDRATATRDLEAAMEEAQQQACEVAWPLPPGARLAGRAHEHYARTQGCGHLLSVPVRVDDEVVAVLALERRREALAPAQVWALRLTAQACGRHLAALQARDRWAGARLWAGLRRWYAHTLMATRHTAWKLAAATLALVLLGVTFTPWPYRVETQVTLRSKDVLFMPAPFDGYLRRVHVEIGDTVKAGTPLVELDTRDLQLEASMAAADVTRHAHDAEKAQALQQLGDMQVTLARQQQAASKLELIRHQLAQAQVRAPHDGVVVEGELKKNLGAPVRKGDLLLKLAQTTDTYLELEIDQVDVHEVQAGSRGEFAFVGRPDLRFPLIVERVDPVATLRDRRNVFLARARVEVPAAAWWRPGMGGTARLEAGDRSVLWIMTHRTLRFLRQVFWL